MDFTEEYQDVLQNIEFALVQVYRRHEEMTDWEAQKALNGLVRHYQALERDRPEPNLRLTPRMEETYESVKAMCDVRLGPGSLTDDEGEEIELPVAPLSIPEIIACLKRIERSIRLWNKELGRRGYYEFVSQYVG